MSYLACPGFFQKHSRTLHEVRERWESLLMFAAKTVFILLWIKESLKLCAKIILDQLDVKVQWRPSRLTETNLTTKPCMCLKTLEYFEKTVDLIYAEAWRDSSVFPISQIAIIPRYALCGLESVKTLVSFLGLRLYMYEYLFY
jgi:hypothetical protein